MRDMPSRWAELMSAFLPWMELSVTVVKSNQINEDQNWLKNDEVAALKRLQF